MLNIGDKYGKLTILEETNKRLNRRYTYQNLGKNPKAKKVVKLSLDNEYICSYDCIKSAMLDNNINLLSSSISACCKHKQKSAYGYKWLYQEEWQKIEDKFGGML